MIDHLKSRLLSLAGDAIDSATVSMPDRFAEAMHSAVKHEEHLELSLLACASSLWCGGDEETGMPAAVGSLLIRSGLDAHLSACGLAGVFGELKGIDLEDETVAILAGDGLFALAVEFLSSSCGRHSAVLVGEAVRAMGARGVLSGMSLEIDRSEGMEITIPDGRSIHELYSGQLARFAAQGGAILAGASNMMLDDVAQVGLLIGRSRYLWHMAEAMGENEVRRDLVFQARTLIEEAQSILGQGDTTLFTSLMYLSDFF